MGLLRKAAATTSRGGTENAGSAAPAESQRPKGPGLFRRSIKALETEIQAAPAAPGAAAPGAAPNALGAAPTALAIELASKEAESEIIPFRIQTPAAATDTAAAAPAAESPAPLGKRFDDILEQVLTAITALSGGVELPSRLFTVLTTLLGVHKGALLLYDPARLVYAPWAVRGFDQTTLHRMRIPLGANDAWNALANGSPLLLADAASFAPFQQYFSAREFSSVSRLVLVPFIAEDKLIAVFLLSQIESPFSSDEELMSCLARAAEAGAPRVHEARAAQIATAGPGATSPAVRALKDEPGQFLSSLGTSSATVLLLSLSLEDYAKSVLSAHEHLDPFRLHEDLLYFLGSFLSDVGRVLSVKQARFTIALPDFDASALDLLSHQLALFLHGLFGGNGTHGDRVLPRIVKSCNWPADGTDLRSLVESLSA